MLLLAELVSAAASLCAGVWIGSGIAIRMIRRRLGAPPAPSTCWIYLELRPFYWPLVLVQLAADAVNGLRWWDWLWLAGFAALWWWLRDLDLDDDDRWRRRARRAAAAVARAGARLRIVPARP